MKKILLVSAVLSLLVSCQQINEQQDNSYSGRDRFIASTENGSTKTALSGYDVIWNEGDEVSVFNGTLRNEAFIVDKGAGGSTTTSLVRKDELTPSTDQPINANIAYYPYLTSNYILPQVLVYPGKQMYKGIRCEVLNENEFSLKVLLPVSQKYIKNSFANESMPMVAVTKDSLDVNFDFKNLCGLLKFQFTGDDVVVKNITVQGNNYEYISQVATVVCGKDSLPVITPIGVMPWQTFTSCGYRYVSLDCGDGVGLDKDVATDFYISLPPTKFEKGITVTITTQFGEVTLSTSSELEIVRSAIQPMEPIEVVDPNGKIDFEDDLFENYLVSNYDKDGDGFINLQEAESVTYINLSSSDVTSLGGIEKLTNLYTLRLEGNRITKLDLSYNIHLHNLYVTENYLADINVSGCDSIESFSLQAPVEDLDLSKLTLLRDFTLRGSNVKILNFVYNLLLESAVIENNTVLTGVEFGKNTSIAKLSISGNSISKLDVSSLSKLSELSCNSNKLTYLDISNCSNLSSLYCYSNLLETIVLKGNKSLVELYCYDNKLTKLDLSEAVNIRKLYCYTNSLSYLNVKYCTYIEVILCYDNGLSSIDLSECKNLTEFNGSKNKFTSLNLEGNALLVTLVISYNNFVEINLTYNLKIAYFVCVGNTDMKYIWLNPGQNINYVEKDDSTELKYKAQGGNEDFPQGPDITWD